MNTRKTLLAIFLAAMLAVSACDISFDLDLEDLVQQLEGRGATTSDKEVPPGAIWVSPEGADSSTCGTTKELACATVKQAHTRVAAGGTIVLADGVYRGQGNVAWRLQKSNLTIMAEPGTTPLVSGQIVESGDGWVDSGLVGADGSTIWQRSDLPTYGDGNPDWGENSISNFPNTGNSAWLDPSNPAAGEYEQLLVKAVEATQVDRSYPLADLTDGFFHYNRSTRVVSYASYEDPRGETVEWTAYKRAVRISASGAGAKIIGITFDRFASINADPNSYGSQAAVSIEHANNVQLTDVTIANSSGRGVYIGGNRASTVDTPVTNVLLNRVSVVNNGATGIDAFLTKNLSINNSVIAFNNRMGFNWQSAGGFSIHAGMKTTWSEGLNVTNSAILYNMSHGLWLDLYVNDVEVTDSTIAGNAASGLFAEISQNVQVSGNNISYNGVTTGSWRGGVIVGGSRNVEIVDNTFEGNADAQIILYDDDETTSPGRSARPVTGFPWNPSAVIESNTMNDSTTGLNRFLAARRLNRAGEAPFSNSWVPSLKNNTINQNAPRGDVFVVGTASGTQNYGTFNAFGTAWLIPVDGSTTNYG